MHTPDPEVMRWRLGQFRLPEPESKDYSMRTPTPEQEAAVRQHGLLHGFPACFLLWEMCTVLWSDGKDKKCLYIVGPEHKDFCGTLGDAGKILHEYWTRAEREIEQAGLSYPVKFDIDLDTKTCTPRGTP